MKTKISADIFKYMIIVAIAPILIIYILNVTLLDSYSIKMKWKELQSISETLTTGEGQGNISRIKREKNVEVYFFDREDRYSYKIDEDIRGAIDDIDWNSIPLGESYQRTYQRGQGISLLMNITRLTSNLYLVITTPVSSVQSAVRVSMNFYFYSFILMGILALIVSYIFSRKVSVPIIELDKKARSLSQLDFSEKIELTTGNEIESLGDSINIMSEKLEQAIETLKASNRELHHDLIEEKKLEDMRKSFISSVNHELKTPLTIMKVYAEGILEGVAEADEVDEYCATIVEEVENMERIITELLYFSEIDAGYKKPQIDPFDLTGLVQKILSKFHMDFVEKEIKINFLMDDITALGDMKLIERVIANFISNAITYVPQGGTIHLEGRPEGRDIRVLIQNNGEKIPENRLEDIWKPFFKIEESRNRKYGGTGLGLSIVAKILEKHSSDYSVKNLDQGVEFSFTLERVED